MRGDGRAGRTNKVDALVPQAANRRSIFPPRIGEHQHEANLEAYFNAAIRPTAIDVFPTPLVVPPTTRTGFRIFVISEINRFAFLSPPSHSLKYFFNPRKNVVFWSETLRFEGRNLETSRFPSNFFLHTAAHLYNCSSN